MTKAFADILEMEQRMRELETKISEMEPTTSVYEGILKEYDQLQHTFSEKMATAMKMKFAQSFTALALMNPFTRKIFKPYLVVKNPACISENAFTKTRHFNSGRAYKPLRYRDAFLAGILFAKLCRRPINCFPRSLFLDKVVNEVYELSRKNDSLQRKLFQILRVKSRTISQ